MGIFYITLVDVPLLVCSSISAFIFSSVKTVYNEVGVTQKHVFLKATISLNFS